MDGWKRGHADYTNAAEQLLASMLQHGFQPWSAIPVDPDGELLNGSHRLACALALDMGAVPVRPSDQKVWAPPWGEAWFVAKGLRHPELQRLREDFQALHEHRDPR